MNDLAEIRKRIEVINEELGETQKSVAKMEGELKWIRILLIAILGTIIAGNFL